LQHLSGDGTLLAAPNGIVHVSTTDLVGFLPSVSDGWHRLTVVVEVEQMPQREQRAILIDGVAAASMSKMPSRCGVESSCPVVFFAVGGLPDRSVPFPLPIHNLRLYSGVVNPADESESMPVERLAALRFHKENSRWVKLSRGADAMDITWDICGWEGAVHEQVRVALEPTGGLRLKGTNASQLWDRAVASASSVTGYRDVTNWTSAALHGANMLRINYVESDPCYDLWDGVECSQSDWPVGRNDCAERLDCAGLGWDPEAKGSAAVCGTSTLLGLLGSSDMCVREASFTGALELCQEMGARLCTADELARDEGEPSTCGYDSILAWT
jgi:hypothetical protein